MDAPFARLYLEMPFSPKRLESDTSHSLRPCEKPGKYPMPIRNRVPERSPRDAVNVCQLPLILSNRPQPSLLRKAAERSEMALELLSDTFVVRVISIYTVPIVVESCRLDLNHPSGIRLRYLESLRQWHRTELDSYTTYRCLKILRHIRECVCVDDFLPTRIKIGLPEPAQVPTGQALQPCELDAEHGFNDRWIVKNGIS